MLKPETHKRGVDHKTLPYTARFCAIALFFFAVPALLYAQVVITEIMYDLPGTDSNEWIEVRNTGSEPVDLSAWKLFEANTNHSLKIIKGEAILPPSGFAIIANSDTAFLSEFPEFFGTLFDSSFSLSNTGETLVMRNPDQVDIDSVSYTSEWGANGDGNSLQLVGNKWIPGPPTPGSVSSLQQTNGDAATSQNQSTPSQGSSANSSSASSGSVAESTSKVTTSFSATIGKDRIVAVGNPVNFKAEVKNASKEARGAAFLWSFGDGSMKTGQSVTYNYRYPGDYVVVLNASHGDEQVVSRVNVKVVKPEILITANYDQSLTVVNYGKDEINLTGWGVESAGKIFVFPLDTILRAGGTIVIAKDITGLIVSPVIPLVIRNPMGVLYIPNNKTPTSNLSENNLPEPPPADLKLVEPIAPGSLDSVSKEEIMSSVNEIELNSNLAAVSRVVVVEKPEGFWSKLKKILKTLFD